MPAQSQFDFLRTRRKAVWEAANKAEKYLFTDPEASAIYSRKSLDLAIQSVLGTQGAKGAKNPNSTLAVQISALIKTKPVERRISDAMERVRLTGNSATHAATEVQSTDALIALSSLWNVLFYLETRWVKKRKQPDGSLETPEFDAELAQKIASRHSGMLGAAKREVLLREEKEAETERLLSAVERLTDSVVALLVQDPDVVAALGQPAQPGELNALVEARMNALPADLEQTRVRAAVLETLVANAAWHAGTPAAARRSFAGPNGADRFEIDDVAWSPDGVPVAVLETTHSKIALTAGLAHAEVVADAIEEAFGTRPVIFVSDGFDHLRLAPGQQPEPVRELDSLAQLLAQGH
jgi:type I restriction enzyme R subunit